MSRRQPRTVKYILADQLPRGASAYGDPRASMQYPQMQMQYPQMQMPFLQGTSAYGAPPMPYPQMQQVHPGVYGFPQFMPQFMPQQYEEEPKRKRAAPTGSQPAGLAKWRAAQNAAKALGISVRFPDGAYLSCAALEALVQTHQPAKSSPPAEPMTPKSKSEDTTPKEIELSEEQKKQLEAL